MGRKGRIYTPLSKLYFMLYFFITIIFMLWLIGFFQVVAHLIFGIPAWLVAILVFLSLFGSLVNIPLFYVKSYKMIIKPTVIRIFFVEWVIPEVDWEEQKTLIAINLGGAIIPIAVSLYLIYKLALEGGIILLIKLIIALIIASILVNKIAKPIPGLGIATPALGPPLITLIIVLILHPYINTVEFYQMLYSVGSLSALIGADLMNLHKIPELGAPVASIGGAGTFDGVFVSGLASIWLAMFLLA